MYAFDLSYDPRDPTFPVPGAEGLEVALQVFTLHNVYGLDPDRTSVELVGDTTRIVADGLSWAGQQQRGDGRAVLTLERHGDLLRLHATAEHAEPIKAVKVLVHGLPEDVLARGWWQMTSPVGAATVPSWFSPVRWRYPWPDDDPWPEWETPWAAVGDPAAGDTWTVAVRSPEVRATRLFVHRPPWAAGTIVEAIVEEDARHVDGTYHGPELRLRRCPAAADVDADVEDHLGWLAEAHHLVPWEDRADVPEWFHDVRLVLNLHGQHWTGYVFNTFDAMADTLRAITEDIDGRHVMAYVPGWEGRYYYEYPHYRPGADLGGVDGFRRLVDTAHGLGVRVMPMFGIHGANAQRYPDWEQAAFRTRTDRMVTLVNKPDWDGDRSGEDDQVFLNPGEPGFRVHLAAEVIRTIDEFGVDGVFLDTSGCWFNDPRFNQVEGYRHLLAELRSRHPEVLFAGEGWFDALLGLFPVNQSWLGTDRRMRHPQLLGRFGRAVGHLSVGAPGAGSTGVHEGGWYPGVAEHVAPAHLPSLPIVDDTMARHRDEVARICRAAAGLSD